MKTYKQLTAEQISALEAQSCRCDDWSQVTVAEDFDPKFVRNVNFSGQVRIGSFQKIFTLAGCASASDTLAMSKISSSGMFSFAISVSFLNLIVS